MRKTVTAQEAGLALASWIGPPSDEWGSGMMQIYAFAQLVQTFPHISLEVVSGSSPSPIDIAKAFEVKRQKFVLSPQQGEIFNRGVSELRECNPEYFAFKINKVAA